MARAKPKTGWRAAIRAEDTPFCFADDERNELRRFMGDEVIDSAERMVAEVRTWAVFEHSAPTDGEVFEAVRRGDVALRKGPQHFLAWLQHLDSKTRQLLLLAATSATGVRLLTPGSFPLAVAELRRQRKPKRGARRKDAPYELSARLAQLLNAHGIPLSGYDPLIPEKKIKAAGSRGGAAALALILHYALPAVLLDDGDPVFDIAEYIRFALSRAKRGLGN